MESVARANRAFVIFWSCVLALDVIGIPVVPFITWTSLIERVGLLWTAAFVVLATSFYQVLAAILVAQLVPYPDRWFGYGRYEMQDRTKLYTLDENGRTFNVSRKRAGRGTVWTDKLYRLRGLVTGPWFAKTAIVAELTGGVVLFGWLTTSAVYTLGPTGIIVVGIAGFITVPLLLIVSFWSLAWGDYDRNWANYQLYHFGDRD